MRCSLARRLLVMEGAVGYGSVRGTGLGRHLGRCARCREEAAALAGEERLIRRAFSDLPLRPGFTEEVLRRIAGG